MRQSSLEQVTFGLTLLPPVLVHKVVNAAEQRVTGKDLLTLKGTGMGLGGLALALLGASVVLTDTAEVLPMLTSNYERNLSPAALRSSGSALADAVGAVEVR